MAKKQKTIALIAHDGKKHEMVNWALQHKEVLQGYKLCGTGTTARLIAEATGLEVKGYLSGPLGFDDGTVRLLYALLLVGAIVGPLLAGVLSDRLGRRPTLVTYYLLSAAGILDFLAAGANLLFLVPLLILLPSHYGTLGVWWSMPIADCAATLLAALLLYQQIRWFRKAMAH